MAESKEDDLPFETQRAINTASLFAEIIYDYCRNNAGSHVKDADNFAKNIMDHIFINMIMIPITIIHINLSHFLNFIHC